MLDCISSKNKNKSPIIFIHGIAGNAKSFRPQLKELKNKHYVIALNLPGYGKSKPIKTASLTSYAKKVCDFIIINKLKLPILAGHSLGGMIVQKIVITHPKIAKACILLGTTAKFGSTDPKWQKNFIDSRIGLLNKGKSMKQISRDAIKNIVSTNASKSKIIFASNIMESIDQEAYKTAINSLINFDLSRKLYKISIPTLLIAGDKDILAPPKTMKKMHEKIINSKYIVLKDCGHLINIEHSNKTNKIIENFIKEFNLNN